MEMPGEALQKRWAAVNAFEVGRDEIVSLVEAFFGFFEGKANFLAGFREAFQEADSAFRMRENNREVSVLAGAILVTVMEESSSELGDLAALALVSCAAQNLRAAPCVADIPELALKHLTRRTISRGKLDPDVESDDENQLQVMQLQRGLDVIGEESNVLWWVFGESSRDTNQRWSECSVPQTALMAGKELADLTRVPPGPAAAAALLDRVVKHAKSKPPAQVIVMDAIAGVPLDWRKNFAQAHCPAALENLRPVSRGIQMSVDLADGAAWVQALPSSTKIQRGGKIAPHLLAYQVFVECLLASLWSKLE